MKFQLRPAGRYGLRKSPPARGAWIEITWSRKPGTAWGSRPARGARFVILVVLVYYEWCLLSPPARGAWIEI